MFRRLAEAFQDTSPSSPPSSGGDHAQYVNSQNQYFTSLPNMILSGTSGLKGFDTAIQSVNSLGNSYQNAPVRYPNNIFIQETGPNLAKQAEQCSASSIDELIAIKNPNAAVGCGWLYSPPPTGSPYPAVSQGFIGDFQGPLQNFNPPDYKKWYFDLQLAKKQMLLDKCKALKNCGDVDSDVYSGMCGYCTDTNQGIPIDSNGQPLYPGGPLGGCSPQSIITSGALCPPPPGSGSGPQPIIDKTCEPVNGRLSAACLRSQVISGGCSDNGSLALALSGNPSPTDYIAGLRNADSVKIYNRVANPPLNMDVFSQGNTTVDVVLKQVRQLASNTKNSNASISAAARDLCLKKGSFTAYDFCNDLPDSTPAPFNVTCLQQIFRKMGGQPSGLAYPGTKTMATYNSMASLGIVKQYFSKLMADLNSTDYATQRNAMMNFLGITPQSLISRAPYIQGVEVIWLGNQAGKPNTVWGVLKRTIETDIVQFPAGSTGVIPQLASTYPGFSAGSCMIQMFDVRAQSDFSTKFTVSVDDGFFIAVNQPANIATTALANYNTDQVGLFSSLQIQNATYTSNSCSNYFGGTPNITKIYYSDAGGGAHSLQFTPIACSGQMTFSAPYYSLTLEQGAPYLNFEVNSSGDSWDDTRNAGLFSSLLSVNSVEYHNRPEERMSVPGKKGFIRLTNNTSAVTIGNIAYQAWTTCTFAFRLQSMPIKDAIFTFRVWNFYCYFYLVPINGSTAQLRYTTNMTTNNKVFDGATNVSISVGTWYFFEVAQNGAGFDVYCDSISNIVKGGGITTQYTKISNSGPITTTYNSGLQDQTHQCYYGIGGPASGSGYASGSFQFDVAWMHFYDYYIGNAEVVKDCQASWQFTQFPNSLNTYITT